jgi:cytochrome c553
MTDQGCVPRSLISIVLSAGVLSAVAGWSAIGQEQPAKLNVAATNAATDEAVFKEQVQPLLKTFCVKCHNADNMESGIRVDQLTAVPEDRQLFLWKGIQKQIDEEAMPPADEPQPTAQQRKTLSDWIDRTIKTARARDTKRNGSVRRLTVAQYRNTLRDLLGLQEDLTDALPPDGLSKDGFANNSQTLLLSPLQVETYFDIAEKALDLCIVDESTKPVIQNFRMDLGASINPQPCPDKLILGANNALLNNSDFMVTELKPTKPFDFQPFAMRTKHEFIEGYVGNDTIRAWKKFDSIYHSVFACVRGTPGYPKGEAHEAVPNGLLLRPAVPSGEIFGQSNTYGPMANFKISLRELPEQGNFRVTVKAARYDDALLLDAGSPVATLVKSAGETSDAPRSGERSNESSIVADLSASPEARIAIKQDGIYQVDVACTAGKSQGLLSLELGERRFAGRLIEREVKSREGEAPAEPRTGKDGSAGASPSPNTAFLIVRLPAGELTLKARYGDNSRLRRIVFSRLTDDSELARRFKTFEQRAPSLGVYVGLRRDCGSTLTPVGAPRHVSKNDLQEFVFEGPINDFPTPDVEKDNVNYLAGIREIGVRSEYTDGRDMPRLLVRSVEFEGPFYESWPPATHRNIFIDSPRKSDLAAYAQDVIRSFATRAFRRPITDLELEPIVAVWKRSFADKHEAPASGQESEKSDHSLALRASFRQSIKDALLVVLTSPQFLFLIENSRTPLAEDLDPYELASKLSYFLWNAPPDQRLLDLAAKNGLHSSLDAEIERMNRDPRFGQFISEFATQWLSLDKFDVVAVDAKRYPKLTRDTKTQLRQEPVQFLRHLIEQNLPLRNLIQSDFLVANEVTASYYNLADRTESGFRFIPIKHENANLGGVLSQASILAGLSDGRESNPIKRGAWLARKIIATPPDDPPPNVPQLKEDDNTQLTLREKLERHRNQKGCVKCHSGIDPWGVPFETFDASGLLKTSAGIDARSKLPDGTEVQDLNGLKQYLANDRIDQVAFSFLKHTACYAVGRTLTYNETVFLQEQRAQLKPTNYRLQELLKFVIKSDLFLKK